MKEYYAILRCKNCNENFTSEVCAEIHQHSKKLYTHLCSENVYGVGELVGFTEEKE